MSRLFALFLALLLASCATSKSGKKTASADDAADNKAWSDSSETSDSSSEDSDSSSTSSSPPRINYTSEQKAPPGPACLDQQGSVQECLSDGDCCKGFYCGLDPEGNTRQKVCLYGG